MTQSHAPFAGNAALIFGGAKGIGRAVALEWARRGARIAVADIDEAAAQATAAEIVAAGGEAVGLKANVLSGDSIAAAAAAAQDALGEPHFVMNNVGAILNGHPEDIPMTEWQRIMDLNYFAAVRGVQHFLPRFIERGSGHFVNTASFAGLYPYAASRMPYAAAKAAVISLTQNLALYLEPMGIRISLLAPGPVLTGVMDSMTSWTEDCPMRGPGSETTLLTAEATAVRLSEEMQRGAIMIPSDPVAFDIVQRWAADPDSFIRSKIAEFAAGNRGNPVVPEAILAMMGRKG